MTVVRVVTVVTVVMVVTVVIPSGESYKSMRVGNLDRNNSADGCIRDHLGSCDSCHGSDSCDGSDIIRGKLQVHAGRESGQK